MKKLLISLAILALPAVASAAPGNGVDLTWQDCVTTSINRNFISNISASTCNVASNHDLLLTFKIPTDLPLFQAITAYLKIKTEVPNLDGSGLLSNFWHYEQGGCNRNNPTFPTGLVMTVTLPSTAGCDPDFTDLDQGAGPISAFAYGPDIPGGGGLLIASLAHSAPLPLFANTNYFYARLRFNTSNRPGAGANCAGCGEKAAIVFNSATLESFGEPDTYIFGNTEKTENCGPNFQEALTINGAPTNPTICDATPVRNRTWGSVKALYR